MGLKDIIVHADNDGDAIARIRAAGHVAEAHGAHLTAVYPIPSMDILPIYAVPHMTPEIIEAQEQAQADAIAAARQTFDTVAAEFATVNFEWREQTGAPYRVLAEQGRYADLLVVGQVDPEAGLFDGDREMPDSLILTAGRPVVVLPFGYAGDLSCRRVLVAWDAGPMAARAVHDALPVLAAADAVQVLAVNPGRMAEDWPDPARDASAHLARHGVNVEADHITSDDMDAGEMLLSRAAEMQADLIVMGAYGHARWSELLLGGVTNRILSHQTLPVLMSH